MSAEQLLREGNPTGALAKLTDQVRNDPAAVKHRIFLFQLLALLGQWDRALTQLNVAGELDAGTLAMVSTYREALRCEVFRQDVFTGKRTPLIFGEPEEWVALMVEAVRASATGKHDAAAKLREKAFELAPTTAGSVNDEAFTWLADGDTRLGPILEVILNGRYYWVPISRVSRLVCEEPEDLRDFVWLPANIQWANGGETVALLPTRYPGSETNEDDLIKLARKTSWQEVGTDSYHGQGQRMLTTDTDDYPLLDIRQLVFDTMAEEVAGEDG